MSRAQLARWIRSGRALVAVLALLGAGADRAWRTWPREFMARLPHPDLLRHDLALNDITLYEQRVERLKAKLPPHGEVGYASWLPPDKLLDDADAVRGYYLTQYVLAPLRVVNDPHRPMVIGNFGTATPSLPAHAEVLAHFDGGLCVYREVH